VYHPKYICILYITTNGNIILLPKHHAINMSAVEVNLHYSVPRALDVGCDWLYGPASFMYGQSDPTSIVRDWKGELVNCNIK